MVLLAFFINNGTLRTRTSVVGRRHGDYQQAIIQPGYAVSLGVDAIDLWHECFLLGEGVQVTDHSFGRGIQPAGSLEELPRQGATVTPFFASAHAAPAF